MHSVLRIDEVRKQGVSKISVARRRLERDGVSDADVYAGEEVDRAVGLCTGLSGCWPEPLSASRPYPEPSCPFLYHSRP